MKKQFSLFYSPRLLLLAGMIMLFFSPLRAQLVINEVSQGASGSKEYVELVVVGTPSCAGIPCVDLRGWYIDDNNGNHAVGAGTGIAQGCIHFSNDPLWSCVPAGEIIVIYNDADLNASIPPVDLSLTDGNCRLVIPISNCTLFERHNSLPSTASAAYPTSGFVACGSWTNISMANGDDSFQTISPAGALVHSVSWGNNTLSPIIYFSGTSAGMVAWNSNAVNTNPSLQGNWVRTSVAGNETPGVPNNAANAAWINSMNNNCTPFVPLTATGSATNASCNCTGTATVNPSGGTSPYTYAWAPSGGNSATATGLCAGSYTCTITDAIGCTQTVNINVPGGGTLTLSGASSNITCNGGCNGTATATITTGTGPFTYAWAPTGGTNATATGLCVGSYTCTVTDGSGCTATQTFSITQPPVLSATSSQNNLACNGINTGSASVVASGGSPGYTYAWSPSGGSSATASGLAANSYTCTITDANGCITTKTFLITQPSAITSTTSQINITCNGGTGSATVNPTGGTPGYTYSWSPSGGNGSTATGLTAGGYTCTIIDANGCNLTKTFLITQPSALSVVPSSNDVVCNGGNSGSATVVVSGGTPGYTYSWSPSGGTNATASSLSFGIYTCTITDNAGCITTQTFSITQPTAITSTTSQVNISCNGGNNGSATVSPTGGTPGYTYTWSPSGGNAATASPLSAGTYTCLITDANGCTLSKTFSLTQPSAITSTNSHTNVLCNGGNTGSATVTPSGGTPGYTYVWSPSGGTASTANNLTSGNYTCTITDANGCVNSQSFVITQPTALAASVTMVPSTCGNSNGSATVTASGGSPGYAYAWSPTGGNAATANNLAAGNYSCTITDANGCALTQTVLVTNANGPMASIASLNSVSCFGGNNGTASISVSGGTGPYTYAWSPSGGTNASASSLTAGIYTVTVTDANGCIASPTLVITEPTALANTISSTPVSCFGGTDGTATIVASGGTSGYSYAWTPSGGNAATANALANGNYSCTITDANGCTLSASIAVTEPTALSATFTTTDVLCNGGNSGAATISPSGGTPVYSYAWSPSGGNAANAPNLTAGNYSCTITDQNGCTLTQSVSITEPTPLAVALSSTPSNCTLADGSVTATPSGGTGTFAYVWSPGAYTTSTVNNLLAGNYSVVVTDQNGCTVNGTVTIGNVNGVTASLASQVNVNCFGQSTGSIYITQSGGNPGYTYAWSPNVSAADSATAIAAGNYQVVVTDASGCTSTVTVNITEPPQLTVVTSANPTGVCLGSPVQLTATPAGGTPTYAVAWTPGNLIGTNQTITPTTSTTYTANVIDQNGCTTSSTVNVTVFPAPSAAFSVDSASGCAPVCVTFDDSSTVNSPSNITTWSWDFGDGNNSTEQSPQHCYSTTGSYNVTLNVITNNGCASTITIPSAVTVYPTPIAGFTTSPQSLTILNPQVFFTDTSSNATSWVWNFGDVLNSTSTVQNPSFTYGDPTCYQVMLAVSNGFGCNDTAYHEVCVDPNVTLYVPNTFTPNGDGHNDVFLPQGEGLVDANYELLIFDRWGNLIFESHTLSDGWDGRVKNHSEISQIDTYVWKISVNDINGESHYLIGHVNLIR